MTEKNTYLGWLNQLPVEEPVNKPTWKELMEPRIEGLGYPHVLEDDSRINKIYKKIWVTSPSPFSNIFSLPIYPPKDDPRASIETVSPSY